MATITSLVLGRRSACRAAPFALKVLSLVELEGRTIELRDGGGTAVLSVVVPAF